MTTYEQLAAPFPADEVQWRVGMKTKDGSKGLALAYIDARAVMDRLDTVVGPANWQDSYTELGKTTICTLALRIDGEWVAKQDGAGASDVEPEKGTISDALKRAAVKWGIGRYLYRLDSPWVELDAHGRIKQPPKLPAWALPTNGRKAAPAAPAAAPAAPANGDGQMTDEQIARFQAAYGKLSADHFEVWNAAMAALGYTEDALAAIRMKGEARDAISKLTATCTELLDKAVGK